MLTDVLGKEIKVGSKIVYPGRQSSCLWMNYGEVIETGMKNNYWGTPFNYLKVKRKAMNKYEKDGKVVQLERIDRVVVLGD